MDNYSCFTIENNEFIVINQHSTPKTEETSSATMPNYSPISKDEMDTSILAIGDNTTTVEAIYWAQSSNSNNELSLNSADDDELSTIGELLPASPTFSVLSDCYQSLEITNDEWETWIKNTPETKEVNPTLSTPVSSLKADQDMPFRSRGLSQPPQCCEICGQKVGHTWLDLDSAEEIISFKP